MIVTLEVLGTPAPKGNARAFVNKKTGRAIISTFGSGDREKRVRGWDAAVREAAADLIAREYAGVDHPVFVDTPLAVELVFRVTRPGGHWGTGKRSATLKPSSPAAPRGKPDSDKLARSTLDALHGTLFDDDGRIVDLIVRKRYAAPGCEGATITVAEWSPSPLRVETYAEMLAASEEGR